MSWTTPKTFVTAEALTASDLNTHLRDNLLHLFNRPATLAEARNYANLTTGSTTMVAVDNTFYNLDVDTRTGKVLVELMGGGILVQATETPVFDILIDGTIYHSANIGTPLTSGLYAGSVNSSIVTFPLQLRTYITNLTPGPHNFKLYWRSTLGSTITLVRLNTLQQFRVSEAW